MATQQITISEKSLGTLKDIITETGRVNIVEKQIDKRSVRALETRGLVKTTENKNGQFVSVTAKGKKFLS
jgi:predicted transcriptional regulator